MITSPAVTRNAANRGLSRAWLAISVFALMAFTGAGVETNNSTVGDVHLYGAELRPLIRGLETTIRAPDGSMVALIGEEARYLLVDHLDSARATVGSGLVHHEYAPYGTAVSAGAGSRYAGHPYDGRRALFETHSRAYDASAGRFLSADPLRANASPYVYVADNPVLFNDPTGAIRTGTVVTPEVLKLSRELVGEISQFESLSRFLWIEMEPAVSDFFLRLTRLYNRDKATYFKFWSSVDRSMTDERALRRVFAELREADPGSPRLRLRERHLVASNLDEFHRLAGREDAYYSWKNPRVRALGGDVQKYYRSPRAMELLRDTMGSPSGRRTGYANCDEASLCIGGRIAETDPDVNVELFSPGGDIRHEFLVVGRDPKTDPTRPLTWNESATIVDAWLNRVEPARQYYTQRQDLRYYNSDIPPEHLFTFD